jgi:hypothetical protein
MARLLGGVVVMIGATALLAAGSVVAAPRSVPPGQPDAPVASAPPVASEAPTTEAAGDSDGASAPEPPSAVAPLFEQSGSGPQSVPVGPLTSSVLVDVTFEGGDVDPFTVTGVGAGNAPTPFAIFATGTGSGRYLLPSTEGVESLDVQAVGNWTIELLPLDAARVWDGIDPIDGTGNDVVSYTGGGGDLSFTIDGDASSTITLVTYTPDGNAPAGFVLTQFGVLSGGGNLPPGPVLLDVGCAETWHLTIA